MVMKSFISETKILLFFALFLAFFLSLSLNSVAQNTAVELDTDLLGNNYLEFNLSAPDPELCKSACEADDICSGWTYVKPESGGKKAWCWLKTGVINFRVVSDCCVSGIVRSDSPPPKIIFEGEKIRIVEAAVNKDWKSRGELTGESAGDFTGELSEEFTGELIETPTGPELDTDRPGGDYTRVFMTSDDHLLCESACNEDKKCAAWTFVKPGFQGPRAQCWLKARIPDKSSDECCVSGVKVRMDGSEMAGGDVDLSQSHIQGPIEGQIEDELTAGEPDEPDETYSVDSGLMDRELMPPVEENVNRLGMDYRSFTLAENEPLVCQSTCLEDPRCRSWTFIKPGVSERKARCRLKYGIAEPVGDSCCVSGVIR